MESWRKPAELEVLHDVPRWMYDKAVPNGTTQMEIVTKPERLGFEWIVSYEIVQSAQEWPTLTK